MAGNSAIQAKVLMVLVALGGIFGAAFFFMKVLVEEIAPLEIVAGRLILGALVVMGLILVRGRTFHVNPSMIGKISLLAVLDSILPYALVAWAEVRVDSSAAAVIISTMPLFTTLFAAVALPGERLAPDQLLAMPLGVAGVVALAGSQVLDVTSGDTLGRLAVVGAAMSYGAAAVYARILLRTQDALSLTDMKLGVAAVMALPLAVAVEGMPGYAAMSAKGWLALMALGILATGLAFALYFWVVAQVGSIQASLVTYIVPVSGLLLGWAVLGEQIGPSTVLGTGLIALSLIGVMYGVRLRRHTARIVTQLAHRPRVRLEPGAQRERPSLAEGRVLAGKKDCA